MKRAITILLALLMALSLAACNTTTKTVTPQSDSDAERLLRFHLSTDSGKKEFHNILLDMIDGARSVGRVEIATIEKTYRGGHDYSFMIYGTFYAYDKYGSTIGSYKYSIGAWVDSDGEVGFYN